MSEFDLSFFRKPLNANDRIPDVFRPDTTHDGVLHARELYRLQARRGPDASSPATEEA